MFSFSPGFGAFLVAVVLGFFLLLATVIGWLWAWLESHRDKVSIASHKMYPHLTGMFLSLVGFIALILICLNSEILEDMGLGLDWLILAWVVASLSLWPMTVYVGKKLRSKNPEAKSGKE